jgi:flagellar motor protein MotB
MGRYSMAWPLVVGLALVLAGCNEPKPPEEETAFDEDAARLQDLQDELARLQAENASHLDRIAALESENGELKTKLAEVPEAAPGWNTIPGGAMIALEGQVLFDSGKAVLKGSGRQELRKIAATIEQEYPGYDIYVFGHTDTQPIRHSGWKDNFELSCQRALAVVRFLRSSGVSATNLLACGAGEYRPVASNATASERALNRRVEIFAMAPHGTKTASPGATASPIP